MYFVSIVSNCCYQLMVSSTRTASYWTEPAIDKTVFVQLENPHWTRLLLDLTNLTWVQEVLFQAKLEHGRRLHSFWVLGFFFALQYEASTTWKYRVLQIRFLVFTPLPHVMEHWKKKQIYYNFMKIVCSNFTLNMITMAEWII